MAGLHGAAHVGSGTRDDIWVKRVKYTGSDALKAGYVLCYDRDNATATNHAGTTLTAAYESWARHRYVEKPTAANQAWIAGFAAKDYTAVTGGQYIDIHVPFGGVLNVFTNANCTINSTRLGVQAGSYLLGATTADACAIALQTVDRSSTNGLVQAQVFFPQFATTAASIITPTSAVNSFSPAIWGTAPWEDVVLGRVRGNAIFEDFKGNYALAANQTVTSLGDHLSGFTSATAGSTITQLATDPNGVLVLSSTTDNEDVGIMLGGMSNVAGGFVFSATTKLYMEARIKTVNVTASRYSLFLGFAEEALCSAAAILEDDDTRSDKDYVAFIRQFADTTGVSVMHNTAGGGGETEAGADVVTMAADTWTNLGLYNDGTNVYFYQNGVLVDTVALAATNFPDGEEMAFYYIIALGHGDDATASIDWVKLLYVGA